MGVGWKERLEKLNSDELVMDVIFKKFYKKPEEENSTRLKFCEENLRVTVSFW